MGAAPPLPASLTTPTPRLVGSKGEWGRGMPSSEGGVVSLSSGYCRHPILCGWWLRACCSVPWGPVLLRGRGRDSQKRPQPLACA